MLIELPDSFNNHRVEIIVLTTEDAPLVHRRPHPDIAGHSAVESAHGSATGVPTPGSG